MCVSILLRGFRNQKCGPWFSGHFKGSKSPTTSSALTVQGLALTSTPAVSGMEGDQGQTHRPGLCTVVAGGTGWGAGPLWDGVPPARGVGGTWSPLKPLTAVPPRGPSLTRDLTALRALPAGPAHQARPDVQISPPGGAHAALGQLLPLLGAEVRLLTGPGLAARGRLILCRWECETNQGSTYEGTLGLLF